MEKKDARTLVKIMVTDSYLRGRIDRDDVASIRRELDADDEPDAPGWDNVLAKSLLSLAILGLITFLGLLGWIMAIR